jgi:hypothetical protein
MVAGLVVVIDEHLILQGKNGGPGVSRKKRQN